MTRLSTFVEWEAGTETDITDAVDSLSVTHGTSGVNPDLPVAKPARGGIVLLDRRNSDGPARYRVHIRAGGSTAWSGHMLGAEVSRDLRIKRTRWRLEGLTFEPLQVRRSLTRPSWLLSQELSSQNTAWPDTGLPLPTYEGLFDIQLLERDFNGSMGRYAAGLAVAGGGELFERLDGTLHMASQHYTAATPTATINSAWKVGSAISSRVATERLRNVAAYSAGDSQVFRYRNQASVTAWGERPMVVPAWLNASILRFDDVIDSLALLRREWTIRVPLRQATQARSAAAATLDAGDYAILRLSDPNAGVQIASTCLLLYRTISQRASGPAYATFVFLETSAPAGTYWLLGSTYNPMFLGDTTQRLVNA